MAKVVGQVGHLCTTSCMPLNTYGIQQQHHVKQQRRTATPCVKLPASKVVTVLTVLLHCGHHTGIDAVCSDWYGMGCTPVAYPPCGALYCCWGCC